MDRTPTDDPALDRQRLIRAVTARLTPTFAGAVGPETVERFVRDSLDQLTRTAPITAHLPVLVERFARDRLRALTRLDGHGDGRRTASVPGVLFLCVHNAGRSQMAAGWLRHLGGDGVVAWSGGSEPASQTNPDAVAAMAEVGIDITGEFPKPWTDEIVRAADVVVTMGCGDACPLFPGTRYEDWTLEDPAELDLAGVRIVRDEIRRRVVELLASLDVEPARR